VAIPPFSIFSAASEPLVTLAVFYVVWRAYARGELRVALLAIVLGFEVLVNVAYMAFRIAVPTRTSLDGPAWLGPFAAGHGLLSLLMLLFLFFLAALAKGDYAQGDNFFRDHRGPPGSSSSCGASPC
jgi:hypothetical protein